MLYSGKAERLIEEKLKTRDDEWFKTLQRHRDLELEQMIKNFQDENFLRAMKAFVYHKKEDINEKYQIRQNQ